MAFLLAPYNNAMRLGQGFNSYTQQICIDDAVTIDPGRAENVLANDGSTMRIMVQSMGRPSAWSRQPEIVVDDRDKQVEAIQGKDSKASKKIEPAVADPNDPAENSNSRAEESEEKVKSTSQTKRKEKTQDGEEDTDEGHDESENGLTPTEDSAEGTQEEALTDAESAKKMESGEKSPMTSVSGKSPGKPSKNAIKDEKGVSSPDKKASTTSRKRAVSAGSKAAPAIRMEQGKTVESSKPSDKEKKILMAAERERELEEKQARKEREKEIKEAEKERKEEEKRRRVERKEIVEWGASTVGYTQAEREAMKHNLKFEDRFNGMLENKKDFEFDPSVSKGPSQIVTYTSRFVDKLSDITEDMNISGSLSIKAGKIGGSGKGAFIDSDKFKSSDLNFYISVKVVNQTINFKDALQYNSLRSVNKDNFREIYGDSFISGFQEGGEFNAVVSMKILNKAKKTDIKAEAKVAFTAGTVDLKAEANVDIAKMNIETNTETTIQVNWSGGGHIKPREQQWDIQSLMQAAARFPDLVAECPQRTYAIITKYDTLRSFVKDQPASYTKLQYENSQLYTNAMMDSYMAYKSLHTQVTSYIFDIQTKTKVIRPWSDDQNKAIVPAKDKQTEASDTKYDTSLPFAASVKGLEDAKKAIRRQMAIIVNEVDIIEKDPKLATNDTHVEPYQSTAAFEERIPKVEIPEKPKIATPLGGKRIMAKTQTDLEAEVEAKEAEAAATDNLHAGPDELTLDEQGTLDEFKKQRPTIATNLRVTAAQGSQKGATFNNLEFLQPQWNITKIQVEIANGALAAFWLYYDNGLILSRGKTARGRMVEMTNFSAGERIVAGTLQTGKAANGSNQEARVISLHFYTNRGRNLIAQADKCLPLDKDKHSRDGVEYTNVSTKFYDAPLTAGNIKGLWGRSDDNGIWRLGFIWGDINKVPEGVALGDISPTDATTAISSGVAKAEKAFQDLRTQYDDLEKKYKTAQLTIETAEGKASRVDRNIVPWTAKEAFKTDRVQIYFVTYGGKIIEDETTGRRLTGYAETHQTFKLTEPPFIDIPDPWYGVQKSETIFYRYNNTGPMRCLSAKHGDTMTSDAF